MIMDPIQKAQFIAQCQTYSKINNQLVRQLQLNFAQNAQETCEMQPVTGFRKRPGPGRPRGQGASVKKLKEYVPVVAKRKGRPRKHQNPLVEAPNATVYINSYPPHSANNNNQGYHLLPVLSAQEPFRQLAPLETLPPPPYHFSLPLNPDIINHNREIRMCPSYKPFAYNPQPELPGPRAELEEFLSLARDISYLRSLNVQSYPDLNFTQQPSQFNNSIGNLLQPFESTQIPPQPSSIINQQSNVKENFPLLSEITPTLTGNTFDPISVFANSKILLGSGAIGKDKKTGTIKVESVVESGKEVQIKSDPEEGVAMPPPPRDDGGDPTKNVKVPAKTPLPPENEVLDSSSGSLVIDTDYEGGESENDMDMFSLDNNTNAVVGK